MSLIQQFCAPDLLRLADVPNVQTAWECLRSGDLIGVNQAAGSLDEADVGIAPYAQLHAALALFQGDLLSAVDILAQAVDRNPDAEFQGCLTFQLGACAREAGQGELAVQALDQAAVLQPARLDTALLHAECLWAIRGSEAGRKAFDAAVQRLDHPRLWASWARYERRFGTMETAKSVLDAALAHHPQDPDLKIILVAWFLKAHQSQDALDTLNSLPSEFSDHPIVLANKGNAYIGLAAFDNAKAMFQAVLTRAPDLIEAQIGFASAAFELGEDAAAEVQLDAIRARNPHHVDACVLQARIYARTKRVDQAKALLAEVLETAPDHYMARYQLAILELETAGFATSVSHAEHALAVKPEAMEVYDVLGLARLSLGQHQAAMEAFAISSAAPVIEAAAYTSNLVYGQHYNPDISADDLYRHHVEYGERFGGQADDLTTPLLNDPSAHRRLRVGYVSPDFRGHSVAFFMMAIVQGHDRQNFEVYAYSNTLKSDRTTEWFADNVDHWRAIQGKTFEEIREVIRRDQIDILVDLAGHTGDNLLPMLARRAAPVQVNYLGYPNTTGVPAIDYRLVDVITDPPGDSDRQATETLYRIADSFLCYRMLAEPPPVGPGPLALGAPMTFGSFNNTMKLNHIVFDAWAEILRAVPQARLLLKAKQLLCAQTKAWVWAEFTRRGIGEDRIELLAFTPTLGEHLDLYGRIDLALDTFPYNGTTTTCEALSMGVPVLTVKGDRHCARVGESLISAIGLADGYIADDVDDYVARAVAFAGQRQKLAEVRAELRARLLSSPLCDEAGFMHKLEAAYRHMWVNWCRGDKARYSLTPSAFEAGFLD